MNKIFRCFLVAGWLAVPGLARADATNNPALAAHAQDLVVLQGEKLVSFKSDTFLNAPYTVLYFGAGWCPDCRKFSPGLVEAYNRQAPGRNRFEVLLLTMDKTAEGMLKFMKVEKMTWPALAFDKMEGAEDLKKYYSGHGIPCLSVIDQTGAVVLQSKSDQDAAPVLEQLQRLLKGKPSRPLEHASSP
ncbi:MAG TPA: thioredoxin-like domain-containing protein [Candidatus Acidoferrum sp.]|jgi:nucleoredoxin|nr:thioredoxin-like domain-containing protein [Candidatus Acidoferrum sp.]